LDGTSIGGQRAVLAVYAAVGSIVCTAIRHGHGPRADELGVAGGSRADHRGDHVMKAAAIVLVTVALLTPAAYATGQALDPRVPQLRQEIASLKQRQQRTEQTLERFAARADLYFRCWAGWEQITADVMVPYATRACVQAYGQP
jgi:hypothetical protein